MGVLRAEFCWSAYMSACERVFQALLYFLSDVFFGHSCVLLRDLSVYLHVPLTAYAKKKRKLPCCPSFPSIPGNLGPRSTRTIDVLLYKRIVILKFSDGCVLWTQVLQHSVYCSICTPLHHLVLPQCARSKQAQADTMQHPIRPACWTGHSNFGGL